MAAPADDAGEQAVRHDDCVGVLDDDDKRVTMKRSQSGFTTVLLALSLVAMLAASALAIDLGQAYSSRRAMQNAADAAALAGTRMLFKMRNTTTGAWLDLTNAVNTAAVTTATDNGATASQVTCTIVRRDLSAIAPCSPSTGATRRASRTYVRQS